MAEPDDTAARLARIEALLLDLRDRIGEVELSQHALAALVEAALCDGAAVEMPDDVAKLLNPERSPRSPRTDT